MTDVVNARAGRPTGGWGNADYPPGMLAAHDAILATGFDTYVGGHVYRTGTRDALQAVPGLPARHDPHDPEGRWKHLLRRCRRRDPSRPTPGRRLPSGSAASPAPSPPNSPSGGRQDRRGGHLHPGDRRSPRRLPVHRRPRPPALTGPGPRSPVTGARLRGPRSSGTAVRRFTHADHHHRRWQHGPAASQPAPWRAATPRGSSTAPPDKAARLAAGPQENAAAADVQVGPAQPASAEPTSSFSPCLPVRRGTGIWRPMRGRGHAP